MSGYAFHPEAFADLDELWEYIAEDNIDAADRVIADIFDALPALVAFPHSGHLRDWEWRHIGRQHIDQKALSISRGRVVGEEQWTRHPLPFCRELAFGLVEDRLQKRRRFPLTRQREHPRGASRDRARTTG